jgi:uncharacterized LabA/DUF88 family protein
VSKNVAVFVDVANIFYAAKAAGADIDYVTLLKAAVAGRDFVRAYAYTGLDPENENQRNFHSFLARHGYKVVSKDIRKYGDGKVKANLDIELVVDMMKTARNLDVAIVVSGDGDFAPAIRAVQEMGVRVEVISFRGNTSSDLIEVADAFYDITQLARVDRDSSRSGRRVAGDDEDLSMTEVPDKQTEGRGGRRGRGRGRGGRPEGAEEVVADTHSTRPPARGLASRTLARPVAASGSASAAAPSAASGGRLVALPGEKLSHAAGAAASAGAGVEADEPIEEEILDETAADVVEGADGMAVDGADSTGRRRRRRGGRGRGHGRTQAGEDGEAGEAGEAAEGDAVELEEGELPAPPAARPNQFGSVWDSQIGMAGTPARLAPLPADDDDYAEPEIPEYLLAERRRSSSRGQGGGRGQGGRGGTRSAYASAVDRERYGRAPAPRYSEPPRQSQSQPPRRRDERPVRQPQAQPQQQHRGGGMPRSGRDSSEPWSEVPPELEEILRAQLSTKLTRPAAEAAQTHPVQAAEVSNEPAEVKAPARRGGRRKPAETGEAAAAAVEAAAPVQAPVVAPVEAPSAEKAKPAPRTRRKAAEASGESAATVSAPVAAEAEPAAPKKRAPARRKTATAAQAAAEGGESTGE